MRFAKWTFLLAGSSGILLVFPPYFLEGRFGEDKPPAINHPEFYYGFLGVALAWQFMFLLIGTDPIRYRVAMLPAIVEKATFAIAVPVLYAFDRVNASLVAFASLDALWLVLFIVAWLQTPREAVR